MSKLQWLHQICKTKCCAPWRSDLLSQNASRDFCLFLFFFGERTVPPWTQRGKWFKAAATKEQEVPSHMDLWTVCLASMREMKGMNEEKKSLSGSDEAAPECVGVCLWWGGSILAKESFIFGKDIQQLLSRLFVPLRRQSSLIIFPLLHFCQLKSLRYCISGRWHNCLSSLSISFLNLNYFYVDKEAIIVMLSVIGLPGSISHTIRILILK